MATNTETQVQQLYVGLLGRAADKAGLTYWANQITTGARTLDDVRAAFVTTTEYTTGFGALTARADLVTAIYTNLFERTPTAAEVAYWVADTRPANQLVSAFLTYASAADQAVITNKTFVAQTYTDTVGTTNFNAAAAKAVIDPVDGTATSVTTAITAITSGSLAGLTPGVNLIAAVGTAANAIDAYAKQIAASNPTFDGIADANASGANVKDGSVTSAEATDALLTATTVRADAANGGAATTVTLQANVTNATNAATAAKALVVAATGGATAIANYDAALAAQKTLLGTAADQAATAAAKAGAQAAFGSAFAAQTTVTFATLDGKTAAATDITTAAELYTVLVNSTNPVERAALVTEVNKVGATGVALVAAADKDVAAAKAADLVTSTKTTLELIDTDSVTAGLQVTDYATKAAAVNTASDLLVKAQAADVAVTAAKTVADQYVILNKATADATTAITTFNNATANVGKVAITALGATTQATAIKDVFYFPTKIAGTSDVTLGATTAFGAGDAIVLGSGYTFNSGALSTGNNAALEVFFVKSANGTQVVVETNAVGSATTVAGTDGTITASNDTAVINLVGVTADHLSFANGVVSYV